MKERERERKGGLDRFMMRALILSSSMTVAIMAVFVHYFHSAMIVVTAMTEQHRTEEYNKRYVLSHPSTELPNIFYEMVM